jgi:LysM repeat protein
MSLKNLVNFLFVPFAVLFVALTSPVCAQLTLSEYIEKYKHIAMEEMRLHGIPASIKLGQGILESGFGNSELAVNANNHFGIKCHGWRGKTYHKDDDAKNECFRSYNDPEQSFRDHSDFLTGRPRYASLFQLDKSDYKGWARGLREAGYATNPRYPELLIRVIEQNNLQQYDRLVLNGQVAARSTTSGSNPTTAAARTQTPQATPAPDPRREEFAPVGAIREMNENNRIKYVIARTGDTPESIAREMGVWEWEIIRYNDLKGRELKPGQIVYLQPKRQNASESWHVVREGESLYDISQKYGIRLKSLCRKNKLHPDSSLQPGTRLKLRAFARK